MILYSCHHICPPSLSPVHVLLIPFSSSPVPFCEAQSSLFCLEMGRQFPNGIQNATTVGKGTPGINSGNRLLVVWCLLLLLVNYVFLGSYLRSLCLIACKMDVTTALTYRFILRIKLWNHKHDWHKAWNLIFNTFDILTISAVGFSWSLKLLPQLGLHTWFYGEIIRSEGLVVHVFLMRVGDGIIQVKFKSTPVNGIAWCIHTQKELFLMSVIQAEEDEPCDYWLIGKKPSGRRLRR